VTIETVIRGGDAPQFEIPGVRFVGLAAPSRGSAGLSTWRITVAPQIQSVPHRVDQDEIFMVTAGELRVTPDGALVRAGDAVIIPAGTSIQLENPTTDEAEAIVAIRSGFTASLADGTSVGTPPWAQ
jgi:mannose-6-phosphate isomerase-like protein (cupin superfamily)